MISLLSESWVPFVRKSSHFTSPFIRPSKLFYRQCHGARHFSTGNWWVLTSGKLFEKRKRKVEAKRRRLEEKANQKATGKRKLTPAELKDINANAGLALRWGPFEYPPFHHAQRNRFKRICEPNCSFRIVITTSKNNVWVTAQAVRDRPGEDGTLWRNIRTLFETNAGCIGARKRIQQSTDTSSKIGIAFGRKCKRFGIACADVVFRQSMRVQDVLKGLSMNVTIKSLTHVPRLPKGLPPKRKKRRRV